MEIQRGRHAPRESRLLPRSLLAAGCAFGLLAIGARLGAQLAELPLSISQAHPGAPSARSPGPRLEVPPGRAEVAVPILEYHYIRVNPDPSDRLGANLSVTPAAFAAQLDYLAAQGFHPVTIAALRDYFQSGRPLPSKPVVLTFDDGYRDFLDTAFPLLQAHHFRSVAYIVPGFLGRRDYLGPAEVAALDRTGEVEIGSHTMTHPDLTTLAPGQLDAQLAGSRAALERLLGHPVLDFCYPAGAENPVVVAAVAAAGYQTATAELPGTEHSWADHLAWTRVRVMGGETLADFEASLGPPEPAVAAPAGAGPPSPTAR